MLTNLYIENIAVIEKSNINFKSGLNVMTGETGAGKSIVIGAINSILGKRISKDLIRTGANSAFVSATFDNLSPTVLEKIKEAGYSLDEDQLLIISREININGKSACYINSRPTTVSFLKELGLNLINIHGQNENYGLLSTSSHISYIDKLGNLNETLDKYKEVYNEFTNVNNEIKKLLVNDMEREQRLDLLRFQVEEIENANLQPGELEQLIETRNNYLNSEKIARAISQTKYLLDGKDEFPGVLKSLNEAVLELDSINDFLTKSQETRNRLQNAFYEIEDCSMDLNSYLDDTFYDQNELDEIEERLDQIHKLKRKYGNTIEEILNYLDKIKKELCKIENSDQELHKLEEKKNLLENEADRLADLLSSKRRQTAKEFSKKVKDGLTYLDMPGVSIYVDIKDCEKYSLGKDKVEFLISTNSGEAQKPLSKIASGGELSRIMLSIKNVLSLNDDVDTMIFDEVDTGISGSAAQKVGLKLKEVSKNRQVICVTHLSQIAVFGDNHLLIKKTVENQRTYTKIETLNNDGRQHEIARIIGGLNITDATLKNAKEMLEMAKASSLK